MDFVVCTDNNCLLSHVGMWCNMLWGNMLCCPQRHLGGFTVPSGGDEEYQPAIILYENNITDKDELEKTLQHELVCKHSEHLLMRRIRNSDLTHLLLGCVSSSTAHFFRSTPTTDAKASSSIRIVSITPALRCGPRTCRASALGTRRCSEAT